MKIYISIVTNKKTGVREVGQVTDVKKTAWIFYKDFDTKIAPTNFNYSHTEEWKNSQDRSLWTKEKEYVIEEDWGR